MKVHIKILLTKIVWFFSRICCIFPINNNKILFLSYDGKQYSDNPKYISDYFLTHNPNLIIVWAFNKNIKTSQMDIDNRIIVCKKGTLKYLFHLFSSKQIVVNDFISTLFMIRKKQILLNTWHGGGTFKTIGMSRRNPSKYDSFFYSAHSKNTTAFSLSSSYFKDTVVTRSFLFFGETIQSGMPRNAVLFENIEEKRNKIRHSFGITDDSIIVLYAPTYRNYSNGSVMNSSYELIDFDLCANAFQKRFGKKTVVFNRSHHIMEGIQASGSCVNVTNYPDMQELIIASDVLISDYSSCMWDYSLTKKPIFVYAPDLHEYENNIDFFMPAGDWGFPLAKNNAELAKNILSFSNEDYQTKLENYMSPLGSYEGINATRIVCEWLNQKRQSI